MLVQCQVLPGKFCIIHCKNVLDRLHIPQWKSIQVVGYHS